MPATLTIRDESAAGAALNEMTLEFLTERITVRELIRSRVYQEVKDHNVRAVQTAISRPRYQGLVTPDDSEAVLNSAVTREPRQIDWKRQFDVALDPFDRGGFLILIDDKQATDLEQEIEVRPGTGVSFVKLTPLVGG